MVSGYDRTGSRPTDATRAQGRSTRSTAALGRGGGRRASTRGGGFLVIVAALVLVIVGWGCGGGETGAAAPGESSDDQTPTLICGVVSPPDAPPEPLNGPPVEVRDRNGFVWDISSAVYKYGFDPERFAYGLGVGAIPPIDNPVFLEPGEPGYPDTGDGSDVIGVAVGGDARAYPVRLAASHEIVNDRVGDVPIAVGYWPLATLAAVYGREIEIKAGDDVVDTHGAPIEPGKLVLELGASGWTYRNVFLLHDRQTGSLWYPYPEDGGLRAIEGPLEGTVLEALEGAITTWDDWVSSHPDSLLLSDR